MSLRSVLNAIVPFALKPGEFKTCDLELLRVGDLYDHRFELTINGMNAEELLTLSDYLREKALSITSDKYLHLAVSDFILAEPEKRQAFNSPSVSTESPATPLSLR